MVSIVGPSPSRVYLEIRIDQGIGYLTRNPSVGELVGIEINPQLPLRLSASEVGDLCTQAWYGSADTIGASFSWIETLR
jgi:hypothetical protein